MQTEAAEKASVVAYWVELCMHGSSKAISLETFAMLIN
jgi:hypothetical protein